MSDVYYIEVEEVIRETDAALLVLLGETEHAVRAVEDADEVWIPKKAIDEESEVKGAGDCGTLVVGSWLEKARDW